MRSIFVLLILVMIGLNGKGQSVTALPDSVLSQCCLEVTLLNGNVTTVDWVFIQYVTRDGTGTKLFVEYAPNFGGIQWETQIRIQDDFDDVLERSKFIVIPFTVGTTDYGINRNWIANIEENTTTGGTWIYGRFGTPTKRKFSAVEDYETMKNLLLACRPRAIVVAENGLYTEGDTVRMGGFLIENTSITTEGYNWQMKDTLSGVEFGLDYLTPETLDTTVYWARRHGSLRQMVQLGRRYYYNSMRDTTGGLYSDLTHSWNAGDPFLQYQVFNPSAPTTGTAWFKVQKDNSFLNLSNDSTNPYYSLGWAVTNSTATLGASESGSGDPGNGVVMGAYGFGTTEYLFMKTKTVDAGTATAGQYLQLINASSGEVDFATIDLSAYLEIADTAAMLAPYVTFGNLAGYPTGSGTADRSARWSATNTLTTGNFTDNGTKIQALLPFQFQTYTTAGLPTGVTGYHVYNTTIGGAGWYDGARWNYIPKAIKSAFTSTYIPFVNSSGQFTEDATLTYTSNRTLMVGTTSAVSTATPARLSTGGTFSNTANANLKILVYDDGGNQWGWGVSSGLTYFNAPNYRFNSQTGANVLGQLDGTGFGIGKTPTSALDITNANGGVAGGIKIKNTNTGSLGYASVYLESANGENSQFFSTNSTYTGYRTISASSFGHYSSAANGMAIQLDGASAVLKVGLGVNEITRTTTTGFGIKTTAPLQELDVNGDAYIRDSTRLTTTPAHSAITGLLTRDANGWVGLVSIGTGLSYSAGALSATGSADGNGIYSGSGTLASHTTRALVPPTGNLYFSQLYNSSADSAFFYFQNAGGGERYVGLGLTDTASTGGASLIFGNGGAGDLSFELKATDAVSGTTRVRGLDGDLLLSASDGNISLTTDVASEVQMVGLVRAKQEAYYEITSTSSPQTFSNTYPDNFVNQGGTQASFTFLFPASPEDGQILSITWGNAISVVTLDGNGNTITGTAVTTATAGTRRQFKYYASAATWIKIY